MTGEKRFASSSWTTSALVRQTMTDLLASDPDIEVIGTALDPFIAAKRMEDVVPDVITLDVEMPRMDGITFLRKIMAQRPIPVIICSTLTEKGSSETLKALEYERRGHHSKAPAGHEAVPGVPHPDHRRGQGRRQGQASALGRRASQARAQALGRRSCCPSRPPARS